MREMKVVVTNHRVIRADENLIFQRNLTFNDAQRVQNIFFFNQISNKERNYSSY